MKIRSSIESCGTSIFYLLFWVEMHRGGLAEPDCGEAQEK
jgi:hypothetical protein